MTDDAQFPQGFRRCKTCATLDLRGRIIERFGCGACGSPDFRMPHPEIVSFGEWLKIKLGWFGPVEGQTWRLFRRWRRSG